VTARPRAAQPADRLGAGSGGAPLTIVLVEPQIPPNTGNVARLCAATGCALHLVGPLGFSIDDRALKRAGLDYWEHVALTVHASLDDFRRAWTRPMWLLSTRAARPYASAAFAAGDALVFGKETGGLPAAFLAAHEDRALRIPMRGEAVRSLNLATAAGIVAYAALARLAFPGLR
jgi:tRNA (cytidine/uridine-2'-O-)-methyltransferase